MSHKYSRKMILDSVEYVVGKSNFVKINQGKIDKAVELLGGRKEGSWLDSDTLGIGDFSQEQKMRYFVLCESLNFCYWDSEAKWRVEHRGKWYSGSFGLMHAIAKAIENGYDLLNPDYLSEMTIEELDEVFAGTTSIPLLKERFEIVQQLAAELKQIPDLAAAMQAENDVELLNKIVANFDNFRDISRYKGREIYFFKRAILLVGDLILNIDAIRAAVKNEDDMLGCADYKIPQVLRQLGILEYTAELAALVDSEQEIPHDSEMEIEIRANMLYAVELIRDRMQEQGSEMNSVQIDNALWLLSKTPEFKAEAKPYHLTRTVYY